MTRTEWLLTAILALVAALAWYGRAASNDIDRLTGKLEGLVGKWS